MKSIQLKPHYLLESLNDWYFNNDGIEKKFVFENFVQAMSFIVQVGFLAEKQAITLKF
jgi:4a-hydroxytetrahydrobiopterin dehydratase